MHFIARHSFFANFLLAYTKPLSAHVRPFLFSPHHPLCATFARLHPSLSHTHMVARTWWWVQPARTHTRTRNGEGREVGEIRVFSTFLLPHRVRVSDVCLSFCLPPLPAHHATRRHTHGGVGGGSQEGEGGSDCDNQPAVDRREFLLHHLSWEGGWRIGKERRRRLLLLLHDVRASFQPSKRTPFSSEEGKRDLSELYRRHPPIFKEGLVKCV